MLVSHGPNRNLNRTIMKRADQRIDLRLERWLSQLLRKAPELAAACDGRMVVEKHAVAIAAFAAFERDRNNLSALGVISESGRVRHANEFELHQGIVDLERCRHECTEFLRIGTIGDDQKLAMIETIRTDRISRARQWHGERPGANFLFIHFTPRARIVGSLRGLARVAPSRRCGRLPGLAGVRAPRDARARERRRRSRLPSAPPSCGGRTRNPSRSPRNPWHDK